MKEERIFNFELTEAEANIIMAALGKLPYEIVNPLITKMRGQYAAIIDSEIKEIQE